MFGELKCKPEPNLACFGEHYFFQKNILFFTFCFTDPQQVLLKAYLQHLLGKVIENICILMKKMAGTRLCGVTINTDLRWLKMLVTSFFWLKLLIWLKLIYCYKSSSLHFRNLRFTFCCGKLNFFPGPKPIFLYYYLHFLASLLLLSSAFTQPFLLHPTV